MTRFRALAAAGVLALTFNFAGCFDGGDPCIQSAAPAGEMIPCD